MPGWRFVLNRRWFGYLAMAIVFAIACYFLAQWQFARRDEAIAAIAKVQNNYDRAPQPLPDVVPALAAFRAADEWTPVEATGTYLVQDQLLVRNRPYGGNPGFEVLTPLRLSNGSIFIVDRGWVPIGNDQDTPDSVPAPPSGLVKVDARLQPSEPDLPGRSAPSGQVATINLPTVQKLLGTATYTGAYGLLSKESPSVAVRPAPAVKPTLDEGPHLSYALQWFAFAIFGFFGLGWAIRQEYRHLNADDPDERARALARRKKAQAKAPTDADIEDAILDGSEDAVLDGSATR
ncbi:MAG: sortase [Glaciihabitans sp.]|nr:sortase [Glaciihabitans sp.]